MCNGVAVRTNQNLICDHLLPKRDLLLQTQLVNDVQRLENHPSATPPLDIMLLIDLNVNLVNSNKLIKVLVYEQVWIANQLLFSCVNTSTTYYCESTTV